MQGKYKIYQGKNGAIYLLIGNFPMELTIQQINKLKIESSFYEIPSFDNELYKSYYFPLS